MCIFTDDVVHAGSAPKSTNVRGFYHVVHEGLCPYDRDLIYTEIQANSVTPATARRVATAPPVESVDPVESPVEATSAPDLSVTVVNVITPPSPSSQPNTSKGKKQHVKTDWEHAGQCGYGIHPLD